MYIMKTHLSLSVILLMALAASCGESPLRPFCLPVLPELPGAWKEVPGEPHWRLEWVHENGTWQECEVVPGREVQELPLVQEWTTAVLAWPFWPEKGLLPGMMRPAGALFPWDVSGRKITLTWEGGVAAVFWKELAAAERSSIEAEGRLPWYLDWPRFRELLKSETVQEDVRNDPWLADWKSIAQKTVQSGFDRRRIVSRPFTELTVPGLAGFWIGSSPFAAPLEADPDRPLILKAADTPETWVSSKGILKCSASGFVFVPF